MSEHEHVDPACDHPECVTSRAFFMRIKELISNDPELNELVNEYARQLNTAAIAVWPQLMASFVLREAATLTIMDELIRKARNAQNN